MSWNQSNGPAKKPANKPTPPSMLKGIAAGLITCAIAVSAANEFHFQDHFSTPLRIIPNFWYTIAINPPGSAEAEQGLNHQVGALALLQVSR